MKRSRVRHIKMKKVNRRSDSVAEERRRRRMTCQLLEQREKMTEGQ